MLENSRISVNQNLEATPTEFEEVSSKNTMESKPSNFECLMQAAHIYTDLMNSQKVEEKCEGPTIPSNLVDPNVSNSLVTNAQCLDLIAGLLFSQNSNIVNLLRNKA